MTTTTPKVILVVEDHPQNLELVTDLLESAGYRVLTAPTAEEGLELTRAHRPDLILMDVRLPGLDGLQATKMLKDDPATQTIPVIALTAYAMPEDRERIRDAGCDGYLTKPLKIPLLLEQLNTYLGQRTSRVM
ncbi:MAG: response regulator [Candidatus Methylomirabilales bacterium]